MNLKGVVFDFNGTLFWDTPYHYIAWSQFIESHGIFLTEKEKNQEFHGYSNQHILKSVFKNKITDQEIDKYILEKENLYHQICFEKGMELAPGVIEFFDFLKFNNIPFTIATSSGIENVEFYFEQFKLSKYFDFEKVAFNNGKIQNKPHPEIYFNACQNLGLLTSEVAILEDSVVGINAAENASAGKIIIVNSNNDDFSNYNYQTIKHFDEIDRNIFKFFKN